MSLSNASPLRRFTPGFLLAPMTPRRTWLTAFLVFCLLGAAWSLAMPYDGPADELQHVLRAYGVWSGQVLPSTPDLLVPQSLVPHGLDTLASCFRWQHTVSAHCAATAGANTAQIHHLIWFPSNAANYSPIYYWLVGWPIRIWPTYFGIIAARLLTTLFMSAFIAFAITALSRVKHSRWMLAGLLVALTPVTVNLEGGVNPAGPEIVVGLALFAALIAIVDARRPSAGLVRLACVSAAFLAVFRSFGPEWMVLILAVSALGLGWPRLLNPRGWLPGLRRVLGNRTLQRWLPLSVVGLGFGLYWDEFTGGVGNLAAGSTAGQIGLAHAYVDELWSRTTYYTDGFIALTSYGDVPTPQLVFYIWFGVCAALILLALAVSSWLNRLRIAGTIAAAYVILIYPDAETVTHGWWLSQGRYALPFIVGAPLLAAHALGEQRLLAAVHLRKLTRLMALILLPIQLVMLYLTMIRFESGGKHLNVLHGSWHPALGPELPLLVCCAGIAVAWYMALRLSESEPELESGSDSESGSAELPLEEDEGQTAVGRVIPQATGERSALSAGT